MTDLEALQRMFARINLPITHKKNPSWVTADRIIVSLAETRMCFGFDHNGNLLDIAWGPWQDDV